VPETADLVVGRWDGQPRRLVSAGDLVRAPAHVLHWTQRGCGGQVARGRRQHQRERDADEQGTAEALVRALAAFQ
jgi:hypothetical protein